MFKMNDSAGSISDKINVKLPQNLPLGMLSDANQQLSARQNLQSPSKEKSNAPGNVSNYLK